MLTGKTRYRIGWRKKLVLQVEYWGNASYGARYDLTPRRWGSAWRDATAQDMQAIERGEIAPDKPSDSLLYPPPPRPYGWRVPAHVPPPSGPPSAAANKQKPQNAPCHAPDAPGGEN